MTWQFWILVALYTFGVARSIANVDKPRKRTGPHTIEEATEDFLIGLIAIGLIVWGAS